MFEIVPLYQLSSFILEFKSFFMCLSHGPAPALRLRFCSFILGYKSFFYVFVIRASSSSKIVRFW
jgi:hypothetical protein